MNVESSTGSGFVNASARRMAFWGSTIVGILGVILAINAGLSDEFTGAGVCLVASATAFGILGYTFVSK